jgi:hypothetical protein
MKLLYCQQCGDIIAPYRQVNKVRYCNCRRHAVWWENPAMGILRVCDTDGTPNGWPIQASAYVLGLHNDFLQWPGRLDALAYTEILDQTPDNYLFKQQNSVIIRFRPGETGDTSWAKLPQGEPDA